MRKQLNLLCAGNKVRGSQPGAEVPNLGYMYPWRYICLSEGVHL